MANIVFKKLRKLKSGKIEIEYTDASGKNQKAVCHDPISCREHANLFVPFAAGLGTMINNLPEEDDSDAVSVEDYGKDEATAKLYDDITVRVLENDFNDEYPYRYTPNTGKHICNLCDGELEYRVLNWSNDSYSGNETVAIHAGHPERDFFMNPSLNKNLGIKGEGVYGSHPSEGRHHSNPPSWCGKCGTLGSLKFIQEAYADRFTCNNEACDYDVSYSIGD